MTISGKIEKISRLLNFAKIVKAVEIKKATIRGLNLFAWWRRRESNADRDTPTNLKNCKSLIFCS